MALDYEYPDHVDPKPVDSDSEEVAAATARLTQPAQFQDGTGLVKGGYWFVRLKYKGAAAAAIRIDKEKSATKTREPLQHIF